MDKLDIFDSIVTILREDSSTKKDLQGADPARFREQISEEMSDSAFQYLIHSYLASFGVISHIGFYPKNLTRAGFRLRFHDGNLYVVEAQAATGLQRGDRIERVDGYSLTDYYEQHREFFVSQTPERHYMDWAWLLCQSQSIELVRNGQRIRVSIGEADQSEVKGKSAFEGYFINPDTYYMRMENFYDEAGIAALYEQVFPQLTTTKYLIIDVRINHGGSDSLYYPLFPYALPAGKKFKDLEADAGYGMEILYTPTNVEHRMTQFQEHLADPALSPESRKMIEEFIQDLQANQDKGYQVCGNDDDEEDFLSPFEGLADGPEKIIVLSDIICGSSGDNFVDIMKKMPKVTVMGRPTLGILDYSNCCTVDFGDYTFMYPTSRSLAVDAGAGMTDKGVAPDILIPWTPQHLESDVDLAQALAYLAQEAD